MAKLSRDDVLKLARLARLRLSDEEIEQFRTEISAILGYLAALVAGTLTTTGALYFLKKAKTAPAAVPVAA